MNDKQMQLIEDQYGKLIHKIAHYISGDSLIASHDDNTQDLWVAAMEAIKGFEKKEGIPFEEFWGTKGFDRYLKTCLWHAKNSKGSKITKKWGLTRNTADVFKMDTASDACLVDHDLLIADPTGMLDETSAFLTEEEQNIVSELAVSPKHLKENGRVNVSSLMREFDASRYKIHHLLESIGHKLNNKL